MSQDELTQSSAFQSYAEQRKAAVNEGKEFEQKGVDELRDRIENALRSIHTVEEALAAVRQVMLHTTDYHGRYEDPIVTLDKTEESVAIVVKVKIWNVDIDGNRYPVEFVATHIEPINKSDFNIKHYQNFN